MTTVSNSERSKVQKILSLKGTLKGSTSEGQEAKKLLKEVTSERNLNFPDSQINYRLGARTMYGAGIALKDPRSFMQKTMRLADKIIKERHLVEFKKYQKSGTNPSKRARKQFTRTYDLGNPNHNKFVKEPKGKVLKTFNRMGGSTPLAGVKYKHSGEYNRLVKDIRANPESYGLSVE